MKSFRSTEFSTMSKLVRFVSFNLLEILLIPHPSFYLLKFVVFFLDFENSEFFPILIARLLRKRIWIDSYNGFRVNFISRHSSKPFMYMRVFFWLYFHIELFILLWAHLYLGRKESRHESVCVCYASQSLSYSSSIFNPFDQSNFDYMIWIKHVLVFDVLCLANWHLKTSFDEEKNTNTHANSFPKENIWNKKIEWMEKKPTGIKRKRVYNVHQICVH